MEDNQVLVPVVLLLHDSWQNASAQRRKIIQGDIEQLISDFTE